MLLVKEPPVATTRDAYWAGHTAGVNHARLLDRWRSITDALGHPHVELDCETFAEIYSTFREMVRAGFKFDTFTVALIETLAMQIRHTDADADVDVSIDDGFEDDERGVA